MPQRTDTQENISDNAIEETIAFWQKRTGKIITREDAREMIVNISGFFRVLDEWDKRDRMNQGDTATNDSVEDGGVS